MQALPQSAGPPSPASPSHILSLLHTQTFFQLHLEFVPSILKETCLDSVSLFTITLSGFFLYSKSLKELSILLISFPSVPQSAVTWFPPSSHLCSGYYHQMLIAVGMPCSSLSWGWPVMCLLPEAHSVLACKISLSPGLSPAAPSFKVTPFLDGFLLKCFP